MTRLTATQANEIATLRERGWSYKRLAARYHVSTGAIHYRCLAAGATPPRPTRLGRTHPAGVASRFGRAIRYFTPAEDAQLLVLARGGERIPAIADALGRAKSSIRVRLLTLELQDELA